MSKLSDFDIDLANGQEGEQLVKELLTGGKTIEVKTDLKWKNTGNLYIETICWSHNNEDWYPSGLSATKADYWAFVLNSGAIMVPTEVLKSVVTVRGRAITCNIQPNPSKGYLIKVEDILDALKNL
jgi:hypothetical protein